MLSVMRDITERKQVEESLRQNENFLSSILEGIGDGVVVIDRDYKIISANRGYLEQTKSRRDDIVGKYCYKVSHHIDVPCFEAGEECSVKNAFAGPGSDIDLLIHDEGAGSKREQLALWLDGWSRSLAEMNYLRTGYKCDGLLDVHYVTDTDIEQQTSFAVKIDAVTDPARPLVLSRRIE